MALQILFILTFLTTNISLFEIDRNENGDSISGQSIENVCTRSLPNCGCSAGETLYAESDSEYCVKEVQECSLFTQDTSGNIHKIYEIKDTSAADYVIKITSDTSSPVCGANSKVSTAPIFVRDYQNKMVWNPAWSSEFQQKARIVIEDVNKVQITFAKHWTGFLVKIYIDCGESPLIEPECVVIKFDGSREYPLTDETIVSIIGNKTLTSTAAPTTTAILNTTVAPTTTVALNTTVAPITTAAPNTTVAPTTNIVPTTSTAPNNTENATTTQDTTSSASTTTDLNSTTDRPITKTLLTQRTTKPLPTERTTKPLPTEATTTKAVTTVKVDPTINVSIPTKAAVTGSSNDDYWIWILVIIILILILLIIFFIWFWRRKRKKELMIQKEEEKNEQGAAQQHASIRHLNLEANESLSSTASVLNKTPLAGKSSTDNPIFEGEEEEINFTSNIGKTQGRQVPKITVERLPSNPKNSDDISVYDEPVYSDDQGYYGSTSYNTSDDSSYSKNPYDTHDFNEGYEDDDQDFHYDDIQRVYRQLESIEEMSPRD